MWVLEFTARLNHPFKCLKVEITLGKLCAKKRNMVTSQQVSLESPHHSLPGSSFLLRPSRKRDRKARFKKASFTFGYRLQPKALEQNSATESRHQRSSIGKSFGSNQWVEVKSGEIDRNPSWTQLRFFTATVCSRARDSKISHASAWMHLWLKTN